MTLDTLHRRLLSLGAKLQHRGYFYRSLFGVVPRIKPDDPKFPMALRKALPELYAIIDEALVVADSHQAEEKDSLKLLFKLHDGHTIESVLLPRDGVCVSSQVGCAVGCVFCMTGKSGLIRQLTDLEIVAQVIAAKQLRPQTRKVVFMGMGEPSHNLKNVLSAIDFLGRYSQIPHKNLVLSTVGDQRVFDALGEMDVKPALAISLHSTFEDKRRELLPRAGKIAIESIVEQAERYARLTGYPIQYQWTLIKGINDGDDELRNLEQLLKGKFALINFIPVNAVEESPYKRPDWSRCREMAEFLKGSRILAKFRNSAAQDIEGGCGQLRSRYLKEEVRCS
jgi:23S rRNA (adenine2503-C2)-methyltransferase